MAYLPRDFRILTSQLLPKCILLFLKAAPSTNLLILYQIVIVIDHPSPSV